MPPRARFREKAAEAKRLRLYRHAFAGNERMPALATAEMGETLWRYHTQGATNNELAAIFGYSSGKAIYAVLKRVREQQDVKESALSESEAESEESAAEDMAESADKATASADKVARSPDDSTQRRFSTPFWAAYARRTQDQHVNSPIDRCNNRHVHLVRLEGEPDFGFEVEERETNRYIVTGVRAGSAADRVGMTTGHRVLMYSLHPMGRFEQRKLVAGIQLAFVPWTGESLLLINALLPHQAIVMKVHSPDGYSGALNYRSGKIALAKNAIRSETKAAPWTQPQRFDEFLVEYDTAMAADVVTTPTSVVTSPRWVPAEVNAVEVVYLDEETKEEDDTGNLSMSSTETESDGEGTLPAAAQHWEPYWVEVPRPPPKPRKHEVSFSPGPNKRGVMCIRLESENTLGLDVREREIGRFMIFGVDEGGPAARAGMAVGQWLVSYKLYPVGTGNEGRSHSSSRNYEAWSHDSYSALNRHPVHRAFIVNVIAPDGFTPECKKRMEDMKDALQSIRAIRDRKKHCESLNKFVIEYDRQLQDAQAANDTMDARKSVVVRDRVNAGSKHDGASSTSTAVDSATSSSCSQLTNGGCDNVFLAPAQDDDVEPDSKRQKLSSLCRSSSARLHLEFFQAGQQASHPFQILLTPEMVRSITASELSVDTVIFFLVKMAQFVPYKRLCVATPSFYHFMVLESKFHEWQVFRTTDAPIVCLPVYDSGRWVLVVVVSVDSRVVVNYFDCQNPDGYVLPVCSRITVYRSCLQRCEQQQ